MIELLLQNIKGGLSEVKVQKTLFYKLLVALIAGSVGFGTFFSALVITNLLKHIMDHFYTFTISTGDILLSSVGFLCLFLFSFLENSSKRK